MQIACHPLSYNLIEHSTLICTTFLLAYLALQRTSNLWNYQGSNPMNQL